MEPDSASDLRLAQVLPELALRWRSVRQAMWNTHEKQIKVTRGLSTYDDQNALYSLGREKQDGKWVVVNPRKIVTQAKGGQSFHNFGLALDSAFVGEDPYLATIPVSECTFMWSEYGRICKDIGLEWGGDWKRPLTDRPHCEIPGLNIEKIRNIFETQGVQGVFKYYNDVIHCGRSLE